MSFLLSITFGGLLSFTHLADDVIKESDERNLGDIEAEMAEMKKIFLLYSGISVSPLQQSVENNDVEVRIACSIHITRFTMQLLRG